jgi:hypothetical protein
VSGPAPGLPEGPIHSPLVRCRSLNVALSPLPEEPVVLHEGAYLRIAALGPVLIAVNFVPPTVMGARRVADQLAKLAEAHPSGVSIVLVPSAPKPALSVEAARAIQARWQELGGRLRCGAVWIRREGFVAAAVRSMVAGVLMLRRRGAVPVEVTGSADEAAQFLRSYHPEAHLEGLQTALEEMAQKRGAERPTFTAA